jgi:hypothetical protein
MSAAPMLRMRSHLLHGVVVAAIVTGRCPVESKRQRRGRKIVEVLAGVDDFSTDNGKSGLKMLDLFFGNGEVVCGQNGEVCKLTSVKATFTSVFRGEPATALGVESESFFARHPALFCIQFQTAHCLARDQPVERDIGIEACNARSICARPNGHA